MTTNDHIAAIKGHLKAIEAEKQPKKKPKRGKRQKRYLLIPIDCSDRIDLLTKFRTCVEDDKFPFIKSIVGETRYKIGRLYGEISSLILSGKIITINEE